MAEDCVGEIQWSSYGYRVSFLLGGKEYYGPYRTNVDSAKADLAKVRCDEGITVRSLKLVIGSCFDVGSIQASRYGYRVRFKKGHKDFYGPYRKTKESAWADLARLNSKKGVGSIKNTLLVMKREVGVRRGGRKSAAVEEGLSPVEEGEEVVGVEEGGV